ncbi:unnamed protein product [Arabidopsis halleri]
MDRVMKVLVILIRTMGELIENVKISIMKMMMRKKMIMMIRRLKRSNVLFGPSSCIRNLLQRLTNWDMRRLCLKRFWI